MATITSITARMVFDSRGVPTVEAEVATATSHGRAIVPSGASTGAHEAVELRDGGDAFGGKGVQKAISHIQQVIAPALIGKDAADQQTIDATLLDLDGTSQKSNLGANAMLAVSLACAHAAAPGALYEHFADLYRSMGGTRNPSLPRPMVNVLNGGVHASSGVDIQEIMLVPVGAQRFDTALQMVSEIFHILKQQLANKGYATTVGDEGGFAPPAKTNREALQLLVDAIDASPYSYGQDIQIALDVASSELYQGGKYIIKSDNLELSTSEMVTWLKTLSNHLRPDRLL